MSEMFKEILGKTFKCRCGKVHSICTRNVHVGEGVIDQLDEALTNCGLHGPALAVYDENTVNLTRGHLQKYPEVDHFVFPDSIKPLHCDQASLETLLGAIKSHHRYIIVTGSGTLNDLTKVAADKQKLPYVCIASAPSMDGFLSANAAVVKNNVKEAFAARPAVCVIADTNILKTAPQKMVLAGIGDALGKFTCNADWFLAQEVLGEHRCAYSWELLKPELDFFMDLLEESQMDSPQVIERLIRILLVTGLVMQMVGNSRPASGAEHLFSHVLEMTGYATCGNAPSLHGLQVALGTWYVMQCFEELSGAGSGMNKPAGFDSTYAMGQQDAWRKFSIDITATVAGKLPMYEKILISETLPLKEGLEKALAEYLPVKKLKAIYSKFGLPVKPEQVNISAEMARFAICHAVDIRPRFTSLDILQAFGRLDHLADRIVK